MRAYLVRISLPLAVAVLALGACTPVKKAPPPAASPGSATFAFTGGPQSFTVPPGVNEVEISAAGAAGGTGFADLGPPLLAGGSGGLGGRVVATIPVAAGETLQVNVGGRGADASLSLAQNVGGFNGGGTALNVVSSTPSRRATSSRCPVVAPAEEPATCDRAGPASPTA
jgi:hypothetical protein